MAGRRWQDALDNLFQEQGAAHAETHSRLEGLRLAAREFMDTKVRPAFRDLSSEIRGAGHSQGRHAIPTFSTDAPEKQPRTAANVDTESIDTAWAELAVGDGPEPLFRYRLEVDVSAGSELVRKRITPYDDTAPSESVKDGLQEAAFSEAVVSKGLLHASREDIIFDFLEDYARYLRSQRQ